MPPGNPAGYLQGAPQGGMMQPQQAQPAQPQGGPQPMDPMMIKKIAQSVPPDVFQGLMTIFGAAMLDAYGQLQKVAQGGAGPGAAQPQPSPSMAGGSPAPQPMPQRPMPQGGMMGPSRPGMM